MHHHGGGYSDVKRCGFQLASVFELLSSSGSALMAGYPENSPKDVASNDLQIRKCFLQSLVCVILFLSHNHPLPQNGFLP